MRRWVLPGLLPLAVLALLPPSAPQAEPVGPALAAASNLSQGRRPGTLDGARALGVRDLRDGMVWARAERAPGTYVFDGPRQRFPDALGDSRLSIVLNWGNPLYDGGDTPHSDAAVAAFGAFAGALVRRFPNVDSLEIGNEFNGTNFVRGPLKDMTPEARARAYVPLLRAASGAARAARPGIRISGGALHSLPGAYLDALLAAGAADHMDTLALHPYSTAPEQLARQIAVLRRRPAIAEMPIEITEFGTTDRAGSASYAVRMYCQMALAGVSRAVWYPLNDRGDGYVPLFTPDGRITPAGRAWRLIAARMERRAVVDAAPDPFGYGCRFAGGTHVLWGARRGVTLPPGARAVDAEGRDLPPPLLLSPDRPVIVIGPDDAAPPALGPDGVIADSFDQFTYPEATGARPGDPFDRLARHGDRDHPLRLMPGQQAPAAPWTPHLGAPALGRIRLAADTLRPGVWAGRPVHIVHRYVAPTAQVIDLDASFAPGAGTTDGISVSVTLNGAALAAQSGTHPIKVARRGLSLAPGDVLELSVGPNADATGDVTRFRITLRAP